MQGHWQKFKAGKTTALPPASAATAMFYSVETMVLPLVSVLPMMATILMNNMQVNENNEYTFRNNFNPFVQYQVVGSLA